MALRVNHPDVDLMMDIRCQGETEFDVSLVLDGDELHLATREFHLEWFSCDRPEVVEEYRAAVMGLICGRYRIAKHYLGNSCEKSQLQKTGPRGWQTIGTYHNALSSLLIPWTIWPMRKRAFYLREIDGHLREVVTAP
jgi:hypothetical protein